MKKLLKQIILPFLFFILLPKSIFAAAGDEALKFRVLIEQKLQTKINETFAGDPKLSETYNKVQNTPLSIISDSPEYRYLINSRELITLNNSPEMQEALKEVVNEMDMLIVNINQEINAITSRVSLPEKSLGEEGRSNISAREIKKTIYAQDAVIKELKAGIDNALLSFNRQRQLYFTDPKLARNVSDFTPIQKPDSFTTDVLLSDVINLQQLIDDRVTSVTSKDSAVAAGDEITGDGLWVKGLKSYAKQSGYGLVQAYKSERQGVVVGMDFIDDIIGLACGFVRDTVNGDISNMREKINSRFAIIYGLYKFDNNLFIDTQVRYGRSYVDKARNNMNLSKDVSRAKTKGNSCGGKLGLGYEYKQGNINIIPTIAVSYDELQVNKYQEKGAGLNREVGSRKVNKTTGLFGVKISKAFELNSYLIIPEIHVKYMHTLHANNDGTKIKILAGTEPLITPSSKLPQSFYKLGCSLKLSKSQPINIEIGYDFGKSKKFYSHTGYIGAALVF